MSATDTANLLCDLGVAFKNGEVDGQPLYSLHPNLSSANDFQLVAESFIEDWRVAGRMIEIVVASRGFATIETRLRQPAAAIILACAGAIAEELSQRLKERQSLKPQ